MAVETHDPHINARTAHARSTAEGPRPVHGLFQSLNNFLATFVAIVHTRLELLTTELQEEVRQVGAILLWAFVAAFAAMMGLFLIALAVIFVFWDTHRLAASVAMVGMFLAVAVVAGLILRHKLVTKPPLLDDTLAELARDRDQLKARL
nr:phage holin family protein [uncultured Steroidobacter sp.]